jgi:hypothetical protein
LLPDLRAMGTCGGRGWARTSISGLPRRSALSYSPEKRKRRKVLAHARAPPGPAPDRHRLARVGTVGLDNHPVIDVGRGQARRERPELRLARNAEHDRERVRRNALDHRLACSVNDLRGGDTHGEIDSGDHEVCERIFHRPGVNVSCACPDSESRSRNRQGVCSSGRRRGSRTPIEPGLNRPRLHLRQAPLVRSGRVELPKSCF